MSRVQLALNVDNLDSSIDVLQPSFSTPNQQNSSPGYANFAVTEPPLKLILMENPGQRRSINHLGVEVADVDTVDAEQTRLADAGLASVDERATTGCCAKQDKFGSRAHPTVSSGRSMPFSPTAPLSPANPARTGRCAAAPITPTPPNRHPARPAAARARQARAQCRRGAGPAHPWVLAPAR